MTNVSAKKHSHKLDKDDLMKILCAAVRCRMTDPGFWRQNFINIAHLFCQHLPLTMVSDTHTGRIEFSICNIIIHSKHTNTATQTRSQKHLLSVQQPVGEETTESRVFSFD
jgi:hypothetical protein